MISEKMNQAINDQIVAELYSSYLYLAMAACFADKGLDGFADWMKAQAQEEVSHAMKFFHYVIERDGRVTLGAIDKPPAEWTTSLDAFQNAYEHEQKVTALINQLVKLAREEDDYASETFLQWYVNEQVEEEATAKSICDKLTLIGDHPQGLFMMDKELGQRTFTAPAESEEK